MDINAAFSIASSGLFNASNQLAVVANNVANQNTTAYATEIANQSSLVGNGVGMGVVSTATTRDINLSLQAAVFSQNATVASLTTQSNALGAIDAVSGTTGAGNDLSSLLGNVQSAFTTLSSSPDSGASQAAVVSAAQSLTSGINAIADAITTQRQNAQNSVVSDVATLNNALGQISQLNNQIVTATQAGQSTASLQNQRDISEQSISSLIGAKFVTGTNGAVQVVTTSGLTLPTDGTQITAGNATINATSAYPGSIPAITLNGSDITNALQGGSIGAAIALRDSTLPTRQAALDEFSSQLANRFSAQGLTLFSDSAGNVPTTGTPTQANYVGFSSQIQVNPAVSANVSLVRDGTNNIAGSATGASAFTTNVAGTAGFTTLISRVLDYALGGYTQSGVAQGNIPTSGLGATGSLGIAYLPGTTLGTFATSLSANDATQVSNVSSQLASETDTQTTLQNQLSTGSAVSVDAQMSDMVTLQNSYGANAKVISAIQTMWTALLAAVN